MPRVVAADPIETASQQAALRSRQLAKDFEEVFRQPRLRTPAQKRVLAHLKVCAGDDGNSYRFSEARDGVAMVAAGIHRDGAKSLLLVIERQLELAESTGEAPKVKPKSIRG